MQRPRFRTKRRASFIRTRRFRLAANGAAGFCARCAICSWERSTFAPRALSAGGPIPVRRLARRHRDVLYDSIALAIGWGWILFWPVIVAALPAAIFLHVKYRRAPRSYLIPRSGWRFWMAYAGLAWLPLLLAVSILIPRWIAGRH